MTAGALVRSLSVATVSTLILQMAVGINMSSPFHPVWRQGVSQLFLLGSGSTSEYRGRQFTSYEVIFVSFKKEDKMFTFLLIRGIFVFVPTSKYYIVLSLIQNPIQLFQRSLDSVSSH